MVSGAGKPMSRRGIAEAAFVVMVITVIGKLVGFFREQLVAMFFGATGKTDAYAMALLIPNYLTAVVQTVQVAFLPVFAGYLASGERERAWRMASSVFTISVLIVLAIGVLGVGPAGKIVNLVAPGYVGERFRDTVFLTRIFLPSASLVYLGALLKQVLNSYQEFAVPAASLLIQNLVIAASVALFAPAFGLWSLAAGTVAGYTGAVLVQVIRLFRERPAFTLSFELDEGTRKVFRLAAPLALATLTSQLYLLVERGLASYLPEGVPAAIRFTDSVRQLPIALFAAAVVTVAYPTLSQLWARGDRDGFSGTFISGFRYIQFIIVPAVAGFLLLANPIIRVIYERGQFTPAHTALTASVLRAFSPAVVGMAGVQLINVAFYSTQQTIVPVLLGIGSSLLNVILDILLVRPLGYVGLGIGNTVAQWGLMASGLYMVWRRIGGFRMRPLAIGTAKILAAAVPMCVYCHLTAELTGYYHGGVPLSAELVRTVFVIGGGIIVYFLAAYALKIEEMRTLANAATRRFRRLILRHAQESQEPPSKVS